MKFNRKNTEGYTLIELMMVVIIITILSSILTPRFDLVLQRANQAKAKSDLGTVRSGLSLYYTSHEGNYPLGGYPEGDTHYTSDGLSMTSVLVPQYITHLPIPKLVDRQGGYNELSVSYDAAAKSFMSSTPPQDVFIVWGPAVYTPFLNSPYAYDNQTGHIYIPNGNYDVGGNYFFNW
jgi:prepilin-type N-terminal cleavage/methylation domain-containing protein